MTQDVPYRLPELDALSLLVTIVVAIIVVVDLLERPPVLGLVVLCDPWRRAARRVEIPCVAGDVELERQAMLALMA